MQVKRLQREPTDEELTEELNELCEAERRSQRGVKRPHDRCYSEDGDTPRSEEFQVLSERVARLEEILSDLRKEKRPQTDSTATATCHDIMQSMSEDCMVVELASGKENQTSAGGKSDNPYEFEKINPEVAVEPNIAEDTVVLESPLAGSGIPETTAADIEEADKQPPAVATNEGEVAQVSTYP